MSCVAWSSRTLPENVRYFKSFGGVTGFGGRTMTSGSLLIPKTLTFRARHQWFYTAMKAEASKSQRFCFVLITVTSGGAQTWRIPQGLQNHMFR